VKIIHNKEPSHCPVCGDQLTISKRTCHSCNTRLEGEFCSCKFCRLPEEQVRFIEIFVKCRGNIKDVERELGISYPTVRSKLEVVIQNLGYTVEGKNVDEVNVGIENNSKSKKILDALEQGEISASEAAEQLRKINKR
jgi:hypothetical protein